FGLQAHGAGAIELDELAAGGDERLRRDAVPEVRGAADDVALDERDVGTQRRGDGGTRVATGATTQDHDARHAGNGRAVATAVSPWSPPRTLIAMSPLRHDPLSGRDVIVAAGRAARPVTFATASTDADSTDACPFCPGAESQTPPEVARLGEGEADHPGWEV